MDFNKAIQKLEEGKKVRRPSWENDSYWVIGEAGIILWADKTPAKIHLNQIKASDWEVYEEKPKVVILDDNALSIMKYAEEYPENWKKICKALDKKEKKK